MKTPPAHSSDYNTIALSFRLALVDYFERYTSMSAAEKSDIGGVIELHARRLTVAVLSAALCEACINAFLVLMLGEESFSLLDKASTPDKWISAPKLIFPSYAFPIGSTVHEDLVFVFKWRNWIMHHKTDVLLPGDKMWKATSVPRLDHSSIKKIASLPVRLLELLRPFGGIAAASIYSSVSDEIDASIFDKFA